MSSPVPIFSKKPADRTSERMQNLFYSITKYETLCNSSPDKLFALAEYHLQDKAATWITRLEREGAKPTNRDDLCTAMVREFVPANEIAETHIQLMVMKRENYSKLQDSISKFCDLIMLCSTLSNEAYISFLNSMPRAMKGNFTQKCPTSQPIDRYGNPKIQAVFDYARKLQFSMKMSGEMQNTFQRSQ